MVNQQIDASGEHPDPPLSPSAAERAEMIAVAAYYLAEQRGFVPGGEKVDWLRAEGQIDRLIARSAAAGIGRETLRRLGMRNALQLWGD